MSTDELPEGGVPWLHDLAGLVGACAYRTAFRLRVSGLARVPRTGPVVLVANHSTLIEPQLLYCILPRRAVFLVKSELFTGMLGWILPKLGQLSVRRGQPDRAPLRTSMRILRAGGLVGVFPEGTRGQGGVVSARRGAAWLVRSSQAVVLPVATRGTLRPRGRGRRFRPTVDVLVGKPFRPEIGPGRAGLDEATEQIRAALAALVSEVDAGREIR